MRKRILTAFTVLLLLQSSFIAGQGDQCPKFRIGVSVGEIYAADTTVAYLNEKHNKNLTATEWINEIESEVFKELNLAGYSDLEFFPSKSNPDADMDFRFVFNLMPWSVDGDEKIPGYEVKYIDPDYGREVTEFRSPVFDQEIAFRMSTTLANYATCLPLMSYILSIEFAVNTDIYKLIKSLIHHYNWPLDKNIRDWEVKHPAPARKPQMEVRYEKDYLSLLNEESRKMEVYIKVKNCHGQYVYDKFHGQPVYFLKEIERLEYKDDPGNRCMIGFDWGIFSTVFTSKDFEAIGQYKVKKGIEPSIEKPRFKTCGIGSHSMIEEEGEIIVRGLELLVEPWRTTIHNGEQTTIAIDLHEIDPYGVIYPAIDQEVEIKVTGLVDGSISPKGKVTVGDMGIAWIDYKAGQQDKQIKITATFTPPGYPEEIKGEATINVKPLQYDATLTIKGSYRRRQNSSYKEPPGGTCTGNGTFSLQENIDASFYVPLKMEDAGDMPILNQRWEYYRPLDINLSSFNASVRRRTYEYFDCGGFGHRTTETKNKSPVNRKVPEKGYLLKSNIILIIDKKTDKVVKIATGGFPVEFLWDETEKTTGVTWSKEEGTKPINRSTHKTDDLATTFTAGPVEDPVPDPTFTSVSESLKKYMQDLGTPLPADIDIPEEEEKPEIEPDLLVKFGDGKTYFGGEGKKIIDNSEGSTVDREEFNFFWQVTRKKKPL